MRGADGERAVDEGAGERLEGGGRLARVPAERAVALLGALGGEGVEGLLEARGLGDGAVDGRLARVECAVEDQRADVLREVLGVGRPEPGAVGEAEVGQLLVAERRPQDVEVTGGVAGADVGEDVRADAVGAALRVLPVLLLGLGDPGRGGVDVEVAALDLPLAVGEAVDRGRAGADTARVEADDVEPLRQRAVGSFAGAEQRRHGAHARRTRATRVDHERPDLVAGRLEAQHAELGGAALGVRVVERDLQPRAVVALLGEGGPVVRAGERGARPPRERLRVEPPEPRRHGVDARRRPRSGPVPDDGAAVSAGAGALQAARAVSAAARSRTGAVRRLRRTAPACQRAGPRRRPPLPARRPPRVGTFAGASRHLRPARVGTFAGASRHVRRRESASAGRPASRGR